MLRDNRTGIEKKTALSRGINARHYSIRNQREIYNNREKRTIVVWHCRSQKKKKYNSNEWTNIFKQRYSLLCARKIRD